MELEKLLNEFKAYRDFYSEKRFIGDSKCEKNFYKGKYDAFDLAYIKLNNLLKKGIK